MWLALILLAPLLHREILSAVEAQSLDPNAQPAMSLWPLKECQDTESHLREKELGSCLCSSDFQVCQPLQLSARVNESIILPCHFTHNPKRGPSEDARVHWRLDDFHSKRYLFNCCQGLPHTDLSFWGRVSLAKEEGQPYTASIRITALRESDSHLYFCRVSVRTKHRREEWQVIRGTNLTVTASTPSTPLPLGLLAGVSTGAVLLAAALLLGLALVLLAQRKGPCQKRTQTRRVASRGQEEKEAGHDELHCRGARRSPPPREKPLSLPPPAASPQAPGEPGLLYASLVLSDAPNKKRPFKRDGRPDEEETTYAAVRC